MAGRITKAEQQLEPDPKFGDKVLSRFINSLMKGGNKATTTRIVYRAFD
jgi:small subunit ribosomal protein S7